MTDDRYSEKVAYVQIFSDVIEKALHLQPGLHIVDVFRRPFDMRNCWTFVLSGDVLPEKCRRYTGEEAPVETLVADEDGTLRVR